MKQKYFFLLVLVLGSISALSIPNAWAVTVLPGTIFHSNFENLTANVSPNFNVTSITVNDTDVFFNDRFFDFQSSAGLIPANITQFTENTSLRLHITQNGFTDVVLFVKGKVNQVQLNFVTKSYGDQWTYDPSTNMTSINVGDRVDVFVSFNPITTSATLATTGSISAQTVTITPIVTLSAPPWTTIFNQQLYVNGSLYSTVTYPPSVIVSGANPLTPQTVPGVLYATTFQSKILLGNPTGGNVTIIGNTIGFGSGPRAPDPPTLTGIPVSPTQVRFVSIAGANPGTSPVKDFSLLCSINGGVPTLKVVNSTLPATRFYEIGSLQPTDSITCQWRDGSKDGWSLWSNLATTKTTLPIIQPPMSNNHLTSFIKWMSDHGGIYFGFTVGPFIPLLLGLMATPKTVGIFAIITLFAMGIVHASGLFVYPAWYWGLMILFGIVLVLSRANEK